MGSKSTTLIFGLVIAVFAYAFFQVYERVEHTIDIGYSTEARKNPYLAAQRYLTESEVDTESQTAMALLDSLSIGETLFVTDSSLLRTEARVEQLLDWVNQGGRLVFAVSEDEVSKPGRLTTELGIEVNYIDAKYPDFNECDDASEEDPSSDNDSHEGEFAEALQEIERELGTDLNSLNEDFHGETRRDNDWCLDQKYLTQMDFVQIEEPFYVHFPGQLGLSWNDEVAVAPFYYALDDAGTRFAQIEWGAGLVTILASEKIWRSERIALFDNAFLLWAVSERTSPFNILYGSAMPSLLKQMWQFGPEFIVAAVFALILWIWHVGKRVLPVRNSVLFDRRSIVEHLEARGDYLWKNGEYDALIQPLKEDILHRCQNRFPKFYNAEPQKRIEIISNSCNLSEDQVRLLFSQNRCEDALQCKNAIEIAQQIKSKL